MQNSFDDSVQSFYVAFEETRILIPSSSDISDDASIKAGKFAERLSYLNSSLESIYLCVEEANKDIHQVIADDCQRKLKELSVQIFSLLICHPLAQNDDEKMFVDSPPVDVLDEDQPAIAFITELSILLQTKSIDSHSNTVSQIIDAYASYQRRVLRQRSKPSIAYLAELRRSGTLNQVYTSQYEVNVHEEGDLIEDTDEAFQQQQKQPHAHTITVIFGESSKLLQPLSEWKASLPMTTESRNHSDNMMPEYLHQLCASSMKILNTEGQKLTTAIIKWIDKDHDIKGWIDCSIAYHKQDNGSITFDSLQNLDVTSLERICNELSFLCQILARYIQFISSIGSSCAENVSSPSSLQLEYTNISSLLSQQCGHYASLEDYFACISLLKAKSIATPVPIITGEKVYVPSIVEDAYFVSQRALERANETMSQHAIITVMHRIEEMWECSGVNNVMNSGNRGVYEALMGEGSILDVDEVENGGDLINDAEQDQSQQLSHQQQQSKNQGGGFFFASAFLEAIEQDIGKNQARLQKPINSERKKPRKKNPESHLLSKICLMNGLSSAASACKALSSLLDSFDPEQDASWNTTNKSSGTSKLLKLSQENLLSHANNYTRLLSKMTHEIVIEWCGPTEFADLLPIDRIQTYIDEQNYCIQDNETLMNEEGKVERKITMTLEEGRFVREVVKGGRCEGSVTMEIVKVCKNQ